MWCERLPGHRCPIPCRTRLARTQNHNLGRGTRYVEPLPDRISKELRLVLASVRLNFYESCFRESIQLSMTNKMDYFGMKFTHLVLHRFWSGILDNSGRDPASCLSVTEQAHYFGAGADGWIRE